MAGFSEFGLQTGRQELTGTSIASSSLLFLASGMRPSVHPLASSLLESEGTASTSVHTHQCPRVPCMGMANCNFTHSGEGDAELLLLAEPMQKVEFYLYNL